MKLKKQAAGEPKAEPKHICQNCKFAFKRSEFSYKKHGLHFCPWECDKDIDYEMFKKSEDTCEDWQAREGR